MAAGGSEPVSDLVAVAGKPRAGDPLIPSGGAPPHQLETGFGVPTTLITSVEQQLNELEAVFGVLTTLTAVAVRRLREARDVGAPEAVCGRTTKGWLREEQFLSGAETSRYLRCVFRLGAYPLVQAAFD